MPLVSDYTLDGTPIASLTIGSEKRVATRCDTCSRLSSTMYSNYARSQMRRGYPGTTFCRGCASKVSAKARLGKPSWNKGNKLPPEKRGANHRSWRGGRYIDAHGYMMVHHHNNTARSKWEHYIKEHVFVMENHQGRKLGKDEIVHHIDGNRLNNVLDNLFLTDSKGHRDAHQTLQEIGYRLVRCGLVTFDRDLGQYVAQNKLRELLEQPGGANQQPSQDGDDLEGPETRRASS